MAFTNTWTSSVFVKKNIFNVHKCCITTCTVLTLWQIVNGITHIWENYKCRQKKTKKNNFKSSW